MKKIIFLHIGIPRTGTTSLQNFFFQFKSKSILYPKFYFLKNKSNFPSINHSVPFFYIFSRKRYLTYHLNSVFKIKNPEKEKASFKKQLTTILKDSKTNIMFSAEDISNLNPQEIKDMLSFLNSFSDYSIKVLCCLRSPWSFVNSAFIELSKQQRVYDIDTTVSFLCDSYLTRIKNINESYRKSSITYFLYNTEITNDILTFIENNINHKFNRNNDLISSNASISYQSLSLLYKINSLIPYYVNFSRKDKLKVNFFRFRNDYKKILNIKGDHFYLNKKVYDDNKNTLNKIERYLIKCGMQGFLDKKLMFSDFNLSDTWNLHNYYKHRKHLSLIPFHLFIALVAYELKKPTFENIFLFIKILMFYFLQKLLILWNILNLRSHH